MNDNEKKTSDWKLILGGILLIVVLFAAIKFIFWGLGVAIPQTHVDVSASTSVPDASSVQEDGEAPSFCVHCGKALPESFEWGQYCPWCGEKVKQ